DGTTTTTPVPYASVFVSGRGLAVPGQSPDYTTNVDANGTGTLFAIPGSWRIIAMGATVGTDQRAGMDTPDSQSKWENFFPVVLGQNQSKAYWIPMRGSVKGTVQF